MARLRIYKLGDIVRINYNEPDRVFKGMGKLVGVSPNQSVVELEVECRISGEDVTLWVTPDNVEMVRESNMVESEIQWSNRNSTIRVFDLADHIERIRFANLASQCYLNNGTVIVRGCNQVLHRVEQ